MPARMVLLGLEGAVYMAGSWSPLSWAGVGAVAHLSSEGGYGNKGVGGEDLGPESELGEKNPRPNFGILQRPRVHPMPLPCILYRPPSAGRSSCNAPSRPEAASCPWHPLPFTSSEPSRDPGGSSPITPEYPSHSPSASCHSLAPGPHPPATKPPEMGPLIVPCPCPGNWGPKALLH